MSTYGKKFFTGKRSWSKIKDTILATYMPPYLTKLRRLGQMIILIDGFAGAGTFGEDESEGSPLIIEKYAQEIVPDMHISYFINNELDHHDKLTQTLKDKNLLMAQTILGDAAVDVPKITSTLKNNETLFIYLDPFGLSAYPFSVIEPLLHRRASTELLLVLHSPALHRLAARHRVNQNSIDDSIEKNHQILTDALGGKYWQDIMWNNDPKITVKEREMQLVSAYCERITFNSRMNYAGFCPIQRDRDEATKYYLVFATQNLDGLKIMNDNMIRAFETHMHTNEFEGTLFSDMDWKFWRNNSNLADIALKLISRKPRQTRSYYWGAILQQHFFRFTSGEFGKAVAELSQQGKIKFTSKTGKLNDDAILYLSNPPQLL